MILIDRPIAATMLACVVVLLAVSLWPTIVRGGAAWRSRVGLNETPET